MPVANKGIIVKLLLASIGALTLGALLPPTYAHAQGRSFITTDAGFYSWVEGGATIPQNGHITEFGGLPSGQKVEYDVGGAIDLTLGYAFNRYLATELLIGGTWNAIDSIEGASAGDTYFGTAPILANVILQCPIPRTRIVPYVGAGAGGAVTWLDTDELYWSVPGDNNSVELYGAESDFVFAWQAFAGVRVDLNDHMSLGVGYRYLSVDPSTYSFESDYGGPDLHIGFSSYQAHMAVLTFQMKF